MLRHQRLRRSKDVLAVYRRGRPVHGALLSVRALRTDGEHSRFAFAVGKKVGKAVVRNRIKRRLRAAIATLRPPGGWDVVVIARAPAAETDYHGLVQAIAGLLTRARVLPAEGPRGAAPAREGALGPDA